MAATVKVYTLLKVEVVNSFLVMMEVAEHFGYRVELQYFKNFFVKFIVVVVKSYFNHN